MRIVRTLAAVLFVFLVGCKVQTSAPTTAPTNLAATAGENRVVLAWDYDPSLSYWVYYKAGTSVSTSDHDRVQAGVTSPLVISGLTNDTQYAFIIAASHNDSAAGPATAVVTATPRLLSPSTPWTVGTPLTSNDLNAIALDTTHYVAVGDGPEAWYAGHHYASTGGVYAWHKTTALPADLTANLVSVIADGARFVALAADGSTVISTDAITWTTADTIAGAPAMHAIAYGSGPAYVAVGDGGAIYRNAGDGVTGTWESETSGTTENLYAITYLNSQFIALGANGTLLTSGDGVTWTAQTSNTNSTLRSVAYGNSTYVAVGDAGTIISSSDGTTWAVQATATTESLDSVCYGPDLQFIAVGTTGTIAYSTTGADGSWTTANAGSVDLHAIVAADVFIAVGPAGTNVSGK